MAPETTVLVIASASASCCLAAIGLARRWTGSVNTLSTLAFVLGVLSFVLSLFSVGAVWSSGAFVAPVALALGLSAQLFASRISRPRARGVRFGSGLGWSAVAVSVSFWILIPVAFWLSGR